MTVEKKTFKNAYIGNEVRGDYHEGDMSWRIFASEGHGNPYGTFSSDEWDMEVTFTKKVKPIEVGQLIEVYHMSNIPYQATVLWYNDKWCLVDKAFGEPQVLKRADL
jgi:hypothetical protein